MENKRPKMTAKKRSHTNGKAGSVNISEALPEKAESTPEIKETFLRSQSEKHKKGYVAGYRDWLLTNHRREETYNETIKEAKKINVIDGSIIQSIDSIRENFSRSGRKRYLEVEDINAVSKRITPGHTYRKNGDNRYTQTEIWKIMADFIHSFGYDYSAINGSLSNRKQLGIKCKQCNKTIKATADEHLLELDHAVCRHGHYYPWHHTDFGKALLVERLENYRNLLQEIRFLQSRRRNLPIRTRDRKEHAQNEEYRSLIRRRLNRAQEADQKSGDPYLIILAADILNVPVDVFTNDTIRMKDKPLQMSERMLSASAFIGFSDLLKMLKGTDKLEIQYREGFADQATPDNFGYGDYPRHRIEKQDIPGVVLLEFEAFFEKLSAVHRANMTNAEEAREILQEEGIPTGKLRKPRKDFIMAHAVEYLEDLWQQFCVTEFQSRGGNFFPIIDLNLFNFLKVERSEDGESHRDIIYIEKERVAVISLFRQPRPRQLIYTTWDNHWHVYRNTRVDNPRLVIANTLRSILGIPGLDADEEKTGHHLGRDFFSQSSWYQIMHTLYPLMLEKLINIQILEISKNLQNPGTE